MSFDQSKAEQFADRLVGALNDGALCLMTSIGHRTELFDSLAAAGPCSSQELADKAGLTERYVREWLGAMVTSRVVVCDPKSGQYSLPEEHAAFLTHDASEGNMAMFAQYIPLLGSVEDAIVDCFHNGGGVPYEKYPRFHSIMAEESAMTIVAALDEHILPLVSGLEERLEAGIKVLDVGCGSGRALNHLASRFPNSSFTGMDLSEEAIANGQDEARQRGLTNLHFEAVNLSDFHKEAQPEAFDFVTAFDAIHDQAQPRSVLKGICNTLKPVGVFLMQDIRGASNHLGDMEHPIGPLLYTVSCLHCMTVSLAQGGEGLGAMWGEVQTRELLGEAGFGNIETNMLDHDFQNNFYVIRK